MAGDTIVIATHNRKKAGEMTTILAARFPQIQFLTLADFENAPEPEETADTYSGNARIKAVSALAFTGLPSVADDAGLEIDALPGELGPRSKRFQGESTTFSEKMDIILDRMKATPDEARTARFRCSVAFAYSSDPHEGPTVQDFEAVCEGRIAQEKSGNGGFGYDPVFFLPELGRTMADLTAEEKHQVSHRGKVLRAFGDWFESSWPVGP